LSLFEGIGCPLEHILSRFLEPQCRSSPPVGPFLGKVGEYGRAARDHALGPFPVESNCDSVSFSPFCAKLVPVGVRRPFPRSTWTKSFSSPSREEPALAGIYLGIPSFRRTRPCCFFNRTLPLDFRRGSHLPFKGGQLPFPFSPQFLTRSSHHLISSRGAEAGAHQLPPPLEVRALPRSRRCVLKIFV